MNILSGDIKFDDIWWTLWTQFKARESAMEQLANSNFSSEKKENSYKNGDREEEVTEEDEFDLAYKMIFTDTLRTRDDQVQRTRWKSCFDA